MSGRSIKKDGLEPGKSLMPTRSSARLAKRDEADRSVERVTNQFGWPTRNRLLSQKADTYLNATHSANNDVPGSKQLSRSSSLLKESGPSSSSKKTEHAEDPPIYTVEEEDGIEIIAVISNNKRVKSSESVSAAIECDTEFAGRVTRSRSRARSTTPSSKIINKIPTTKVQSCPRKNLFQLLKDSSEDHSSANMIEDMNEVLGLSLADCGDMNTPVKRGNELPANGLRASLFTPPTNINAPFDEHLAEVVSKKSSRTEDSVLTNSPDFKNEHVWKDVNIEDSSHKTTSEFLCDDSTIYAQDDVMHVVVTADSVEDSNKPAEVVLTELVAAVISEESFIETPPVLPQEECLEAINYGNISLEPNLELPCYPTRSLQMDIVQAVDCVNDVEDANTSVEVVLTELVTAVISEECSIHPLPVSPREESKSCTKKIVSEDNCNEATSEFLHENLVVGAQTHRNADDVENENSMEVVLSELVAAVISEESFIETPPVLPQKECLEAINYGNISLEPNSELPCYPTRSLQMDIVQAVDCVNDVKDANTSVEVVLTELVNAAISEECSTHPLPVSPREESKWCSQEIVSEDNCNEATSEFLHENLVVGAQTHRNADDVENENSMEVSSAELVTEPIKAMLPFSSKEVENGPSEFICDDSTIYAREDVMHVVETADSNEDINKSVEVVSSEHVTAVASEKSSIHPFLATPREDSFEDTDFVNNSPEAKSELRRNSTPCMQMDIANDVKDLKTSAEVVLSELVAAVISEESFIETPPVLPQEECLEAINYGNISLEPNSELPCYPTRSLQMDIVQAVDCVNDVKDANTSVEVVLTELVNAAISEECSTHPLPVSPREESKWCSQEIVSEDNCNEATSEFLHENLVDCAQTHRNADDVENKKSMEVVLSELVKAVLDTTAVKSALPVASKEKEERRLQAINVDQSSHKMISELLCDESAMVSMQAVETADCSEYMKKPVKVASNELVKEETVRKVIESDLPVLSNKEKSEYSEVMSPIENYPASVYADIGSFKMLFKDPKNASDKLLSSLKTLYSLSADLEVKQDDLSSTSLSDLDQTAWQQIAYRNKQVSRKFKKYKSLLNSKVELSYVNTASCHSEGQLDNMMAESAGNRNICDIRVDDFETVYEEEYESVDAELFPTSSKFIDTPVVNIIESALKNKSNKRKAVDDGPTVERMWEDETASSQGECKPKKHFKKSFDDIVHDKKSKERLSMDVNESNTNENECQRKGDTLQSYTSVTANGDHGRIHVKTTQKGDLKTSEKGELTYKKLKACTKKNINNRCVVMIMGQHELASQVGKKKIRHRKTTGVTVSCQRETLVGRIFLKQLQKTSVKEIVDKTAKTSSADSRKLAIDVTRKIQKEELKTYGESGGTDKRRQHKEKRNKQRCVIMVMGEQFRVEEKNHSEMTARMNANSSGEPLQSTIFCSQLHKPVRKGIIEKAVKKKAM